MYRLPIYQVMLQRSGSLPIETRQLSNSRAAAEVVRSFLDGADREHFVILMLDRKNKAIGIHVVSIGSLTAAVVHPANVFKPAILHNAAAIICAHNHPSSDTVPSAEDKVLTARLCQAGRLLGIPVLDHLIIGDGTDAYMSFADEGLLERDQLSLVA